MKRCYLPPSANRWPNLGGCLVAWSLLWWMGCNAGDGWRGLFLYRGVRRCLGLRNAHDCVLEKEAEASVEQGHFLTWYIRSRTLVFIIQTSGLMKIKPWSERQSHTIATDQRGRYREKGKEHLFVNDRWPKNWKEGDDRGRTLCLRLRRPYKPHVMSGGLVGGTSRARLIAAVTLEDEMNCATLES